MFFKKLELRYLNKSNKSDVKLSDKIIGIKMKAKILIENTDEFDPIKHEIKLVYTGKILEEDYQLGHYLKKGAIVQVFKKYKNLDDKNI